MEHFDNIADMAKYFDSLPDTVLYPAASEEQITAFEKKHGFTFPKHIREWLSISGGGEICGPGGFQFYGVNEDNEFPVIDVNDKDGPGEEWIIFGRFCDGDPVLFHKTTGEFCLYNYEVGYIEPDERYPDFLAFLNDLDGFVEDTELESVREADATSKEIDLIMLGQGHIDWTPQQQFDIIRGKKIIGIKIPDSNPIKLTTPLFDEKAVQRNKTLIELGNMGYVIATKRVAEEKQPVLYMYREKGTDGDSGWRFFAGTEDQEYVDNPDNLGIYNIATIYDIDNSIEKYLHAAPGTAYERADAAQEFTEIPFPEHNGATESR